MCTEIDKHCEMDTRDFYIMSSIETENQLSYCGSIIDIFCKEMRADKDRFSNKPTLSAFLSDKPTLSADNVGFFRETYFI